MRAGALARRPAAPEGHTGLVAGTPFALTNGCRSPRGRTSRQGIPMALPDSSDHACSMAAVGVAVAAGLAVAVPAALSSAD